MNIETIITSGVTAFLGALAAITFQSWREHKNEASNKLNILSQAKSLTQQNWLTIEVFLENAQDHDNNEEFHLPNIMPESALTNSVTEKLAKYLPCEEYELVILAQLTHSSSKLQVEELRRIYYQFESRSLGAGRGMNEYEIRTLKSHMSNYIKVLKNTHAAQAMARKILIHFESKAKLKIFNEHGALNNYPALILLYIIFTSYSSVLFYILWQSNV